MIVIIVLITAVMVGATWVALAKPGKSENLIQYGYNEEDAE